MLQGDLKTIKSGYGKNNVQIEYEGNGDFLEQEPAGERLQQLRQLRGSAAGAGRGRATVAAHGGGTHARQSI